MAAGQKPLFLFFGYIKMKPIDELKSIIDSVLANNNLELVELYYRPEGRVPILRIFIDKVGGTKISDCEKASREIEAILDTRQDLISPEYNLEVSSPGLDRPLKTQKDFQRVRGKSIEVHLLTPIGDSTILEGRVIDCGEEYLRIEASSGDYSNILLKDILKAKQIAKI